VVRVVERLGFDARRENGRIELRPPHVADLRDVLGVSVRICDLTSTEVRVLGALRGAPLGLVSARAVAQRAAISPIAASRALKTLESKGLIGRERTMIAAGRARHVELFYAKRLPPRWAELAHCSPAFDRRSARPPGVTRRSPRACVTCSGTPRPSS
jgi:predicted transcriptional regulator